MHETANETSLSSVLVTTTQQSINENDRLRLLASVLNEDTSVQCIFTWSEISGLLSKAEFENGRRSDVNSANFVLEASVLSEGLSYEFQVEVTTIDGESVGSASIQIYVRRRPSIVDASFVTVPSCNATLYASFGESLTSLFDISIQV